VLLLLSCIALLRVVTTLIILKRAINVDALVLLTVMLTVHPVIRCRTGVYLLLIILSLLVVVTHIIRVVIVAIVPLLLSLNR
jgi:hypothetical protein